MNIFKSSCLCVSVLILGCVPSLHEGYTPDTVIYDESLIGVWNSGKTVWVFAESSITPSNSADNEEQNTIKGYKLTHTDENGKHAEFNAVLFKVEETRYLDLSIADLDVEFNNLAKFQLIPAHLFVKLGETSDELDISFMNPQAMGNYVKANPGELPYTTKKNMLYLTASTQQIQAVLKKSDTIELFGKSQKLIKLPE